MTKIISPRATESMFDYAILQAQIAADDQPSYDKFRAQVIGAMQNGYYLLGPPIITMLGTVASAVTEGQMVPIMFYAQTVFRIPQQSPLAVAQQLPPRRLN